MVSIGAITVTKTAGRADIAYGDLVCMAYCGNSCLAERGYPFFSLKQFIPPCTINSEDDHIFMKQTNYRFWVKDNVFQ